MGPDCLRLGVLVTAVRGRIAQHPALVEVVVPIRWYLLSRKGVEIRGHTSLVTGFERPWNIMIDRMITGQGHKRVRSLDSKQQAASGYIAMWQQKVGGSAAK